MVLSEKQVMNVRRAGLFLGLGIALFYLYGWVIGDNAAARQIILYTVGATLLMIAIAADFMQSHQEQAEAETHRK